MELSLPVAGQTRSFPGARQTMAGRGGAEGAGPLVAQRRRVGASQRGAPTPLVGDPHAALQMHVGVAAATPDRESGKVGQVGEELGRLEPGHPVAA